MTQNNKYANRKIYKITDNAYTKCYIGSTIQPLSSRMAGHRRNFTSFLNGKQNLTNSFCLFEEFGIDNCKIELIEKYPCENKEQLLKKEGEYIRCTDCVNKLVAGRTRHEYREANKDNIKQYYESNKERIKDNIKQYYEANKDIKKQYGKQYYEANKDIKKQYDKQCYEANKERRKERDKAYYEAKKDNIKDKKKQYYEDRKAKLAS